MASSDDEGETFPDVVTDYYFNDKDDEPLSFSKLPVQWNESESSSATAGPIFLRGNVDNGLGKFYRQVKAWKYDILATIPEILVLSKDNHWIKLKKPRKSYEKLIRSILISLHCLCFFKSKPEASGKSLWDHLSKVFSLYDIRPSENDLIDHINFLREAVKRDETLAKSKFLAAFVENPRKRISCDEDAGAATKPSFIVDDINGEMQDDDIITNQTEDSDSDGENDHFDSVCAICDNGGQLTCCEGKCFRSFHATPDSEEAQESNCKSLCLTPKELEALQGPQEYTCENCQYSLHQCFVCGELGSSDKSSNTEVYRCSSATCGYFYHPKCVVKLLQKNDKVGQETLKEKIAAGEPFICPAHKCAVCNQTENEKVEDLQFAICRRCPKSYHRKCLPRDIMFEHQIGDDDDDEVRAWDGLLAKSRALIYCLKHAIDPVLETPARTIIFRNVLKRKTEQSLNKKPAVKVTGGDSVKKAVLKSQKGSERSSAIKPDGSSKKRSAVSSELGSSKKKKVADVSNNSLRRSLSTKVKKPSPNDGQPSLGSRLFDLYTAPESNNMEEDETFVDDNQAVEGKSQHTEILPPLDDESKQRIVALMREAASSVTLDEVKNYYQGKLPSTHALSSRADKSIMLARVEGSVEAINVALKKLEEGCSVEDAMAVCEPRVIDQMMRWKDKLKVYLAPFLHGMRYTSFGRHFTKVVKLEEIVDKLHWYVEDGDMIVDFCCGANDFSCLMKKRLDEMGKKKCSYKNYDINRPKDDFNFEKKDWMTVSPKELPSGSRLVMGLNPPFGKNAALANKFIDHALKFKPKLLVLIVPLETERLDGPKRSTPYDLVWEDVELLAGMSFYLPGSADVNDKQIDQWNNIAPPLYLWSRPDYTNKHKSIAQQHGHIPQVQQPPQSDENRTELSRTVGKVEIEDSLPVINEDSKTPKNRKNKKRKKGSPGGTGANKKQLIKEEKGNPNPSKKANHNQESKIVEHDKGKKVEEAQAPFEAPKREITQAPVEVQEREKTRAPVKSREHEKTRAPVEVQEHEKPRAPVKSREHEKTQAPIEVQKRELTRVSSPETEVQKHKVALVPSREHESNKHEKSRAPSCETEDKKPEKTRATSREIEAQKHEKSRAPSRETEDKKPEKTSATSREIEAQKHEKARVSPREMEAQKLEKTRGPSREIDAQKHEKARASSIEMETQKLEKTQGPSREIEAQKHEKARVSPRDMGTQKYEKTWGPSREIEAQKHVKSRASPREMETQKHEKSWGPSREKAWASPREMETQKHEKSWGSSREYEPQKFESKRPSPHTREDNVHDTLNADFSFANVDQSFDQHEGKYNSAIDESTFSLQNDLSPHSFNEYPARRYGSANEESYISSSSHRRLEVDNHGPPGFSVRSDHPQYPGYDRGVGKGPYYDEMVARSSGGYPMTRHDPGLTRYGSTDTTPYNRTSTSATQRYAPRLDELNHTRVYNSGRSELDDMNHLRMGGLGRPEAPMGSHGVGGYNRAPVNLPGYHMDSRGFVPGPYHPNRHNSSGGWLNE